MQRREKELLEASAPTTAESENRAEGHQGDSGGEPRATPRG